MRTAIRAASSLCAFAAIVALFGYGFWQLVRMMPQAGRGMVIFAQSQKDLFVDSGLIHESYRAAAPRGLALRLREQTVIVAARTSEHSAYMGAGVILGTRKGIVEILTARHIVRHRGKKIVIFPDHAIAPAVRVVQSKDHDLALVFVRQPLLQTYPSARVSHRALGNGERFVVMGHPGARSWFASPGVAQARMHSTLLFCPTCERGDSGAGAFDAHGELHGIIVAKEIIAAPSMQSWHYVKFTAFEVEPPDAIRSFLRAQR